MRLLKHELLLKMNLDELNELFQVSMQFGRMKILIRNVKNGTLNFDVWVARAYDSAQLIGWTYLQATHVATEIGVYVRRYNRRQGVGSALLQSSKEFHNKTLSLPRELISDPWDAKGRLFFNKNNVRRK